MISLVLRKPISIKILSFKPLVLNPLGSWWAWGLQEEAMKDVFPCNLKKQLHFKCICVFLEAGGGRVNHHLENVSIFCQSLHGSRKQNQKLRQITLSFRIEYFPYTSAILSSYQKKSLNLICLCMCIWYMYRWRSEEGSCSHPLLSQRTGPRQPQGPSDPLLDKSSFL